jgi:hypothetical protein
MAIPILWRTTKERYNLQGEVCPECDRVVFPPRRLCPYCGRNNESLAAMKDAVREVAMHEDTTNFHFSFVLPRNVEMSAAGDD